MNPERRGASPGHSTDATDDRFAAARRIADSVLYEGYVLFPYRASAPKNRFRWQWGVLVPTGAAATGSESSLQCQCLLDEATTTVEVRVRFLHLRQREVVAIDPATAEPRSVEQLEAGGRLHLAWDEGTEREVGTGELDVATLLGEEYVRVFSCAGDRDEEPVTDDTGARVGTVVRTLRPVKGAVVVAAQRRPSGVVRLQVVVENRTGGRNPAATRDGVLRQSLIGVHLLLAASDDGFVSLLDPPEHARDDAAACENQQTYPVLVGDPGRRDLVLSSPIILYDHPQLAPESVGDAYDATEIDELLSLTVRSLTDAEKREARATDPRAATVIDRADHLPPALLERLHGVVRSGGPASGPATADDPFAAFFGVGETPREAVRVGDLVVRVGSRVGLRPRRRADAQDLFAAGRPATVRRIVDDVDGVTWVGVTFDDDPGADLHDWYGRFLYFHPDEVEPWMQAGPDGPPEPGRHHDRRR